MSDAVPLDVLRRHHERCRPDLGCETCQAIAEAERLLKAIKVHHDQRADDRCHLDDDALYAAAGLEPADKTMPPREKFLANCGRFYDRRCIGGDWPSYQELEARIVELERRWNLPGVESHMPCGGCGGPHQFDTSVPSVVWNEIIRAQGLSEFLCASCIVREFVKAGRSFTAQLWSDQFHGTPIEVVVDGSESRAAALIGDENNRLRAACIRRPSCWEAAVSEEPAP